MAVVQHTKFGRVLIAGVGRSGLAVLEYLLNPLQAEWQALDIITEGEITPPTRTVVSESDYSDRVGFLTFSDDKVSDDINSAIDLPTYDLCVVSPGIAPGSSFYKLLVDRCTRVISEIEFAYTVRPSVWVAITGTNGKTTTTALATHLLNTAGLPAVAVGNIGDAATAAVATEPEGTIFVAEVSSFQLHGICDFRPKVGVLLNITPDHIDWHGSLETYTQDKARVFLNSGHGDMVILNADDSLVASYAEKVAEAGAHVILVSTDNPTSSISQWCEPEELGIKGEHNVSNALVAAQIATSLGASSESIRAGLLSFQPIKHRLQLVETADGREWYNDSKATNPDAVLKALSAFPTQRSVLLLGGRNKGNSFTDISQAVQEMDNVFLVICFGEAGETIAQDFESGRTEVVSVSSMQAAVELARERTKADEAVLLSPGCASFDEFNSFEHRGDEFIHMASEA